MYSIYVYSMVHIQCYDDNVCEIIRNESYTKYAINKLVLPVMGTNLIAKANQHMMLLLLIDRLPRHESSNGLNLRLRPDDGMSTLQYAL